MRRSIYCRRSVPIRHRQGGLQVISHGRQVKKRNLPLRMRIYRKIVSTCNSRPVSLIARQIRTSWERQAGEPSSVCLIIANRAHLPSILIMLDTFKTKVKESGKHCPEFGTETFFACSKTLSTPPEDSPMRSNTPKAPPRLLSDQLINVFFQEWAPLFPILHRPTFLNVYTQYVGDSEGCKNQHSIAQLNLVFCISAQSMDVRAPYSSWWTDSVPD